MHTPHLVKEKNMYTGFPPNSFDLITIFAPPDVDEWFVRDIMPEVKRLLTTEKSGGEIWIQPYISGTSEGYSAKEDRGFPEFKSTLEQNGFIVEVRRNNAGEFIVGRLASTSSIISGTSRSSSAGNKDVPRERKINAYPEKRQWVEKAVELTREIIEDDRRKRKTPASKRQCEMHALLLNYILNSMGIKSQVIGLDYRWLNPHWMGLHYCVLIEDEIFADAYPEGNRLFDEWLAGRGFVLFPGDQFYDEYAEGLRQAQVRIWRSIPPERLLDYKNYSDQLNSLREIYMSKIDTLAQSFSKATNINISGLLESLNIITAINAAA